MCRTCRHYALEYELENYAKNATKSYYGSAGSGPSGALAHCPLCHSTLLFNNNTRKQL